MDHKFYKYCIVPQCESSTIKTPEKLFIHVPRNEQRRKWLQLARRDVNVALDSKMYFCEDHFDLPNDMENYMEYHVMGFVSQVRMKPDILPSKFDCQPDRRKRASSSLERPCALKRQRMTIIAECLNNRQQHCQNYSSSRKISSCTNEDVPLHIFPNPIKFPDRFKTWVNLVGGKLEAPSDYEFYKKQRLCDIHFSIEQKNRFKRLNALAVPSLHLPDNRSVSRENQGLQEAAPSTVNEELDTSATAEVQQSLDKSPGPVEEEADNKVAGEVQGLQETSSPGPVDEEPDAPVEVKEVCRVCLAFHVKMYNVQEHNLCQMLYDITGIEVGENDGIFQYVCYECAARLSAASAFRHKALQSDGMLQRLMNCGDTIAEQITFLKENLEILKPTLTVQEVFITTDIAEEPNIKLNLIDDKTVETTKPVIIHEKYKDIVKTFCDVETIDNFVPAERSLTMNEDGSVTICENIKEHESTTLHGEEDNCNAITKEELTRRVKERLKVSKCCNVPDLAKDFGVTTELVQKIIDDTGLKKGYKRKKGSPQNQRGAGKKSKVS
ncbi:uncharacterized protein LOC124644475 isoform X5 [Helicoverpa zea]|uniref:uncharacterized protein LOC124644475 isoform X4 n=1 Tax=Helicoverpa zea TaxID=7113 RepID=UPI001F5887C6|nr:uncharacterized protein LOC124644475 isoform X4 [Helicoverpa zea]XP_047039805.1 uncharacterized protein LOC124644475 isoform X5 [Helicoverpa zea]